jgi:hypothetical protein
MARKTNPRSQKIVQHRCIDCGFQTEAVIVRRVQDRKCPKCEYYGVKMMIPYVHAFEVAQHGSHTHFIEFPCRDFHFYGPVFREAIRIHADVEAYCLWKKNTGQEA